MNTFTIAVAQINALPHQVDYNTQTILSYMQQAKDEHADMILFPECFLTGYHFPI